MTQTQIPYPDEPIAVEQRPVWKALQDVGGTPAENLLCDMVEALVVALVRVEKACEASEAAELSAAVGIIADQAAALGLTKLAAVAESVAVCAARRDAVGLAATVARMSRIGDKSLAIIWHVPAAPA